MVLAQRRRGAENGPVLWGFASRVMDSCPVPPLHTLASLRLCGRTFPHRCQVVGGGGLSRGRRDRDRDPDKDPDKDQWGLEIRHHLVVGAGGKHQVDAEHAVAGREVDALVAERVWQEMVRALGERRPAAFIEVLRECDALSRILPEVRSTSVIMTITSSPTLTASSTRSNRFVDS